MEKAVVIPVDKRNVSHDLEILETRTELIAKDAHKISASWKLTPVFLYFLCAITGYICSILFYILWTDIFGGNCPIWAELVPPSHTKWMRNVDSPDLEPESIEIFIEDWRRNLIITFNYEMHCKFYFSICLCSCLFGIMWLMLFWRCAIGIYAAQWLVVPPAFVFHLIFTTLTTVFARDFQYGYTNFTSNLRDIAAIYMNQTELASVNEDCQLVDYYLEVYDVETYDTCQVQPVLQILSWIMTISWLAGLAYLILRIICVHDFKLRKTRVYRVHYKIPIEPPSPKKDELEVKDKEIPPERGLMKKLLFFIP